VSHYEQRLANDKDAIRQRIVALGRRCSDAVSASVEALLSGDHARSYRIVVDDLPINRESRSIDRACHAFVARHLPSASHLRFISAVMRMNVELERVGDYAAGIARHAVQLERPPEGKVADEMRTLVARSSEMMADALSAFEKGDAELARETKPVARAMQHSFELVFQAKNICEETLFELLGETKPPKRYRILFVDGRHSLIAPLAEMLARKAFPNSGQYESAGYQPADALADDLLSLAMDMGLDVGGIAPTDLKAKNLSKFHVVVWLNGNPGKHIDKMPYQTVLVAWDLPKLADAKDGDVRTQVREIANALSAEIRDLMVTMRGEDAD
jgi:phosphate uptake regulator/protein-tyrosine-phosphatase